MGALGHAKHVSLQNIPTHLIVERVTELGLHLKAKRENIGQSGRQGSLLLLKPVIILSRAQVAFAGAGGEEERAGAERDGCLLHTQ